MFSFIILNYNNISETINCLKKIKRYNDCNFVVVDNNTMSSIDEEEVLKYTDDLIKLDDNYGFAKANNIGIKYAKDKYNSLYYIVINNDVEITQSNFLDIIVNDYNKYSFDMLGPWIDTPGYSVNPFNSFVTENEILKEIDKARKMVKICNNPLYYFFLMLGVKVKGLFVRKNKPANGEKLEKGVALHCCAIVFSKKYIDKYNYPFYNETFLFHEEDFLFQRVLKDGLVTIYDPDLKVYHKEGVTMKKNSSKERIRRRFRESERIKSLELLLKECGR